MKKTRRNKAALVVALLVTAMMSTACFGAIGKRTTKGKVQPMVVHEFIEKAKENENWKVAFATGAEEQIVFMNVSFHTNPNNDIGMEVHSFDQVILIVEGEGKAVLNGKTSTVEEGSMIFIPKGTQHNIINLGPDDSLKLISFYSDTDIPEGSVYKTKGAETKK